MGPVCISAEADIIAGVVVLAVGVDTLRHVGHDREAAMAALPVVLGLHQLIEVPVWWGAAGLVGDALAGGAAFLYLAIAFGLLPWLVPVAVRRLEPEPERRRRMTPLVVLGVIVAIALMIPTLRGPIEILVIGNHLSYAVPLIWGSGLAALYVVATCGSLVLSSDRVITIYGIVNLLAVSALAVLLVTGVISLWCVWAAATSIAIAIRLRRLHRQHSPEPVPA